MKRMIPLLLSILLLTGCGGNSADGAYQQITQEEAKSVICPLFQITVADDNTKGFRFLFNTVGS